MRRRPRSWLLGLIPTIALLLSAPAAALAASRLALVIGDAAYPARPLATTVNDAALVAQALAQAGFDVTAAHDLDAAATRAAFASFADAARAAGPDATILVYLAGYGVQYDGDNYLVPVDARLVHDDDVPKETSDLDDLGRTLAAIPARKRLLVYDLARANPFATADEMPLADGLALAPPPQGTLVAFNAAPGMAAPQADPPYGAYARALAEMIGTPGLTPGALLERVRLRVGELTDGTQVPWDDGAAGETPFLPAGRDPPSGAATSIDAIPVDALSPDIAYSAVVARDSLAGYAEFLRAFPDGASGERIRALLAVRRESLMFQAAAQSSDPRALWTYVRRYPHGPHLFDARRRLAALHASLEPPPRFDIVAFPDLPPPTPAEMRLVAAPLDALRGLPPILPPPAALLQPAEADYYDALPPPAPGPAGLLPIAAPLPRLGDVTGDDGRITQSPPGKEPTVTLTDVTPDGATLTLADASGPIAEVAASSGAGGSRTILVTDAKKAVMSRTSIARTPDGLAMVQTGVNGGILYAIATRTDPEGARVTRVTGGRGQLLATWRRDLQGIVVSQDKPVSRAFKASPMASAPTLHGRMPEPAAQAAPATAARKPLPANGRVRPAETPPPSKPRTPEVPTPPRPVSPTQVSPSASPPSDASRQGAMKPGPSARPEVEAPQAAVEPSASRPPLPPDRPATKPKPRHADPKKARPPQALKVKHAPAPARPAKSKHAPAKHAPAARKPAAKTEKPKSERSRGKAGRR